MYIFWTILGIFFLYWDLIKKNAIKLILATTFLFCAIVAYKFPQNYLYQGICLFLFGGIFYSLITAIFEKEKKDKIKNNKLNNFIGKKAIVSKDIGKSFSIDGIGLIRYKNQIWQAKSIDDKEIKAGNKVEIISKENSIMNVRVINNAKKQ